MARDTLNSEMLVNPTTIDEHGLKIQGGSSCFCQNPWGSQGFQQLTVKLEILKNYVLLIIKSEQVELRDTDLPLALLKSFKIIRQKGKNNLPAFSIANGNVEW